MKQQRQNKPTKKQAIPATPDQHTPGSYPQSPWIEQDSNNNDLPSPGIYATFVPLKTYQVRIPQNYTEAINSEHAEEWKTAMSEWEEEIVL